MDRWVWAVRLYKTRSAASDACAGGHVRVNGASAKAATRVKVGDLVEARVEQRDRAYEVVRIIEKRVGASVAAECIVDRSPPPPERDPTQDAFARDRGSGRPTKRDRRDLDRHRRR